MLVLLVVLLLLVVPLALVAQVRLPGPSPQSPQPLRPEDQATRPIGLPRMPEEALRLWAQIQTFDDLQESSKGPGGQARQTTTFVRAADQAREMKAVDSLHSPFNRARPPCPTFGRSDPLSRAFTRGLVEMVCACALVLVLVPVYIQLPLQVHIQLEIRFHLHPLSHRGP